ncbi:MAG: glutamine amidotransferase [Myxococcales bacterium]|jgi:GMP synthase (glutamine-hydrolysing)|nr:glutamine amidotransferase [Myxococcales bacterium]
MTTRETTRPLAIWTTGEPVTEARRRRGSFAQMIQEVVGDAWRGPWLELDVRDPETLVEAPASAGVILTGSAARIADQSPWMVRVQEQLRALVEERVPIFGICFGHQLLGMALGGRSGPNPLGREIGTATFSLTVDDPLFGEAPRSYPVSTTHLDSVLELPPGAVALGSTPGERLAAIRFGERAWGVQFHPEFDAEVVGDYVRSRLETLRREGFDPEGLLAARRETPESADLLRRFAWHVRQ